MRMVVQRVKQASVSVDGCSCANIEHGLLVLTGFGLADAGAVHAGMVRHSSTEWKNALALLEKLTLLRIFPDEEGRMNKSLIDCNGGLLLVSQFTLLADCTRGRRPSFQLACPPEEAALLFDELCHTAENMLPGKVQRGIFGANMDVSLVNWGPVTICLESPALP